MYPLPAAPRRSTDRLEAAAWLLIWLVVFTSVSALLADQFWHWIVVIVVFGGAWTALVGVTIKLGPAAETAQCPRRAWTSFVVVVVTLALSLTAVVIDIGIWVRQYEIENAAG